MALVSRAFQMARRKYLVGWRAIAESASHKE